MNSTDMDKTALTSDSTISVVQPGENATLFAASVVCPVCNTENSAAEKYCGECGFLMSSVPGEVPEVPDVSECPRLIRLSDQREYLLHEGENTVGRENADVLLTDPTVSRKHALVILEAGKCWVEDLGSTNGTFVNGVPLAKGERLEISTGSEVKFGSDTLSLVLPGASKDAAEITESPEDEIVSAHTEGEGIVSPEVGEFVSEEAGPSESAMAVAKLVCTSDPSKEFVVQPGLNTIGRRTENNIALSDDPYVSGRHAELVADSEGFWLTDVGSTNGTVLNGSRISPNVKMALRPGDEVVLGRTSLRLELLSNPEERLSRSETENAEDLRESDDESLDG